jgi:glycine oxidase
MAARVLVVGGGVIGLSCAWRLAEAGHEVSLVTPEPGRDGASWVAAGMLAPVTEVQFGEAPLTELLLEGAAAWKEFAASLERASGQNVGYDESGTLTVALNASDRAALDQLLAYQHSLGCTAHRRTASECRALVPSLTPTLRGGIEVPEDHHVDNRALLGALVRAGGAKGVRFVPLTVERVSGGVAGPGVHLSDGSRLGSDYLLLAAGTGTPHIGGLDAAGLPEIRPVKGHILRLGPADGLAATPGRPAGPPLLPRTVRALVHGRSIYLVPRPDGTLVVGATMEERGTDLSVRAGAVHELLSDARAVVPGIDELELLEARTGLRPATPDNTPVVGWTALPGVAVASGHFRNGMLLAPLTATRVVELFGGLSGGGRGLGVGSGGGSGRGSRGGSGRGSGGGSGR